MLHRSATGRSTSATPRLVTAGVVSKKEAVQQASLEVSKQITGPIGCPKTQTIQHASIGVSKQITGPICCLNRLSSRRRWGGQNRLSARYAVQRNRLSSWRRWRWQNRFWLDGLSHEIGCPTDVAEGVKTDYWPDRLSHQRRMHIFFLVTRFVLVFCFEFLFHRSLLVRKFNCPTFFCVKVIA